MAISAQSPCFGVAPFADRLAASCFSERALVPMRFQRNARRSEFSAGGEHCGLGEVSLNYMWSRGRYVARSTGQPPEGHNLLLTLCLRGSGEIQSRAPVVIRAGQFVILPCAGTMTLACEDELATLSLRMPVSWLIAGTGGGSAEALLCRPIPARRGMAAVLADTMLSFWHRRGTLDQRDARGLADVAGRLLRAAIEESALPAAVPALSHQALFWAVAEDVRAHMGTGVRLDVAQTARRVNRSVRAVQAALRAAGTTYGALAMETRLAQAATLLRSPLARQRSITELALALGFEDLSHFSRRFRERYGVSPRQYRTTNA